MISVPPCISGKTESDGFYPNGLLPNEAASVIRELEPKRWAKAERHTAELIARIQPNWPAEKHRNDVASYVQRLISECILCQVFTFGSVPLKTYLPDGDIDLTAFSLNPSLKDNWAIKVRDMLEREENNRHAEFQVKEVQYIQAEVKIIKCLVDNIVVDISFNQLGGLCTLCFLEEVDSLIDQDHLFKRSIILIKAWCFYESRILGAHHGLISTYALETLVLYIFHVFNSSFAGPLEVLYRFLEFFSKFDWENYCVSLWGPVPISSLPNITAKPPRKDGGDLLLSQMFLDACNAAYAVIPGGHDNKGQPFISKHFNVIDPLRTNNNLGRSVNKGNFFRIRSAFVFGAQRLARLLECPEVNIVAELNHFFMNTWERHGRGLRPDACITDAPESRIDDSEHVDNLQNYGGRKKATENSSGHNFKVDQTSKSRFSHVQHGNLPVNRITKILNESVVGHPYFQQSDTNSASLQSSDEDQQGTQRSRVNRESQNDGGRTWRTNPVISQFARTYSSPELRNTSNEVMSQGRQYAVAERLKDETKPDFARGNWGEVPNNHCKNPLTDEPLKETFIASIDRSVDESVSGACPMRMHQEGKYFAKVKSSSRRHNFYGQVQMPLNFASQLPVPIPASFLEYAYHNSLDRIRSDLPSFDSRWESIMHQPHVPFPLPVSQDFSHSGKASEQEELTRTFNSDLDPRTMIQKEDDDGVRTDSESYRELDHEVGKFQAQDIERKQQSTSAAAHTLGRTSNSDHHGRKTHHNVQKKEKWEFHRHNYTNSSGYKNDRASGAFSTASSRFSSHSGATLRSKSSSENWWDGSPSKSTATRNRFGRKKPPAVDPIAADIDRLQFEGEPVDHECGEVADSNDQISVLTTETTDPSASSSHVEIHQVPGSGVAHLSYPNLVLPIPQMPGNVGSQHIMAHNHAVVPIAFYPAGPPVPFVTLVPFYNIPTETGTYCESTNHIDVRVEDLSSAVKKSDQHEDSVKTVNQPGSSNTYPENEHFSFEYSEERKSDILTSDLASHRLNLQYGRLCQNPQSQGPLICPPSVVAPPLYLQGHQSLERPGRPLPVNAELYNHFMNLDPHLMSVASSQPGSTQSAGVSQQYGGEIARSRAGTGTYLPKTKVFKDRNYSSPRNHRGNFNTERRRDHNGEREANWNANSRAKVSGRGRARYQSEKANMRIERPSVRSNELDRPWGQMRHNLYKPHRSTSGTVSGSRSARNGLRDAGFAMCPMPSRIDDGVSPSGDAPSRVVMYPNDQTMVYGSLGQQVQIRPVKSMHSFRDDVPELCQYSRGAAQFPSYECDSARSSPDRPIS